MKRFAELSSENYDISNLQLSFWRAAVAKFRQIELNEPGHYDADDFIDNAAIVVVLAGTSLSQLVGQNVAAEGERVPSPQQAIKDLANRSHRPYERVEQRLAWFLELYDSLRHFGRPKHSTVESLDEESLCESMNLVQDIWRMVLEIRGEIVSDEFNHSFDVEEQQQIQ